MTSTLQPVDNWHLETAQKIKERAEQMIMERGEQIQVEMEDEVPVWFSSQTEEETDLKQAEEKTRDGHEHEGGEEHTEAAQTQTEKKKEE